MEQRRAAPGCCFTFLPVSRCVGASVLNMGAWMGSYDLIFHRQNKQDKLLFV